MDTSCARARGDVRLIAAEAAIFTIFVVAYLFYVGKSVTGPQPKDVSSVPIFYTICLLSSSLTIHFAAKALREGRARDFAAWWFVTISLGAVFLYGTAHEWRRLIYHDGLTISTNLFGTTYYSLVGLHGVSRDRRPSAPYRWSWPSRCLDAWEQEHAERVDVLSLYWHFVDAVWVVVFTVVYVIGREEGLRMESSYGITPGIMAKSKCPRRRRGQSFWLSVSPCCLLDW